MLILSQTSLFRFSILRTFRLLRVFRPFRYNNTLLLYVLLLGSLDLMRRRLFPPSYTRRTIEVMYLSFRRSQDALLALGFFVLMVVVVFSTLLYVTLSSCLRRLTYWHRDTSSSVVLGTTHSRLSSTQMAILPSLRSVLVGRAVLMFCLTFERICQSIPAAAW